MLRLMLVVLVVLLGLMVVLRYHRVVVVVMFFKLNAGYGRDGGCNHGDPMMFATANAHGHRRQALQGQGDGHEDQQQLANKGLHGVSGWR